MDQRDIPHGRAECNSNGIPYGNPQDGSYNLCLNKASLFLKGFNANEKTNTDGTELMIPKQNPTFEICDSMQYGGFSKDVSILYSFQVGLFHNQVLSTLLKLKSFGFGYPLTFISSRNLNLRLESSQSLQNLNPTEKPSNSTHQKSNSQKKRHQIGLDK